MVVGKRSFPFGKPYSRCELLASVRHIEFFIIHSYVRWFSLCLPRKNRGKIAAPIAADRFQCREGKSSLVTLCSVATVGLVAVGDVWFRGGTEGPPSKNKQQKLKATWRRVVGRWCFWFLGYAIWNCTADQMFMFCFSSREARMCMELAQGEKALGDKQIPCGKGSISQPFTPFFNMMFTMKM